MANQHALAARVAPLFSPLMWGELAQADYEYLMGIGINSSQSEWKTLDVFDVMKEDVDAGTLLMTRYYSSLVSGADITRAYATTIRCTLESSEEMQVLSACEGYKLVLASLRNVDTNWEKCSVTLRDRLREYKHFVEGQQQAIQQQAKNSENTQSVDMAVAYLNRQVVALSVCLKFVNLLSIPGGVQVCLNDAFEGIKWLKRSHEAPRDEDGQDIVKESCDEFVNVFKQVLCSLLSGREEQTHDFEEVADDFNR